MPAELSPFYNLTQAGNGGPLVGDVDILGVPHIVELIEVADDDDGKQYEVSSFSSYDKLQEIYDGDYETVELADHPGKRYVVLIHPRCR